jgi:hypothetical protein
MPRGTSQLEWTTADDEDDEQPLLAEDYIWLMRNGLEGPPELVPDLAWVWDLGTRGLLEYQLRIAARQPAGSA